MFYFVYEWYETLCPYWQCLINYNAQKKITRSMITFCNLAPSIDITCMPVAKELWRFSKHKTYHVILQEVRKQSFGSRSSDSWCNWKKNSKFSSIKYTFAPKFEQGSGGRIALPWFWPQRSIKGPSAASRFPVSHCVPEQVTYYWICMFPTTSPWLTSNLIQHIFWFEDKVIPSCL